MKKKIRIINFLKKKDESFENRIFNYLVFCIFFTPNKFIEDDWIHILKVYNFFINVLIKHEIEVLNKYTIMCFQHKEIIEIECEIFINHFILHIKH